MPQPLRHRVPHIKILSIIIHHRSKNYLKFLPGERPLRFENINKNDATVKENLMSIRIGLLGILLLYLENGSRFVYSSLCVHFPIRHENTCHVKIQNYQNGELN
jgi:hypothetical protein